MEALGRVELPTNGLGKRGRPLKTSKIWRLPRKNPAKYRKIRNPGATAKQPSLATFRRKNTISERAPIR
jgi:hypothetical protein